MADIVCFAKKGKVFLREILKLFHLIQVTVFCTWCANLHKTAACSAAGKDRRCTQN